MISRTKQQPRLAISDQLPMSADVRGDDEASLGHRFQRLQRGHELGNPVRRARVHDDIEQIVVAIHCIVWNPAGEDHPFGDAKRPRQPLQRLLLEATSNEDDLGTRLAAEDQRERIQ